MVSKSWSHKVSKSQSPVVSKSWSHMVSKSQSPVVSKSWNQKEILDVNVKELTFLISISGSFGKC